MKTIVRCFSSSVNAYRNDSRRRGRGTRLLAAACCLVLSGSALAQAHHEHGGTRQPYAGLEKREIKALSPEEVAGLQSGSGMGFAQSAELNHYPGPKHVLELADALGLSAEQKAGAQALFDEMNAAAVEAGGRLLEAERQLDQAFAEGSIDRARLDEMTAHIGSLGAGLRAIHLSAHLGMRELLTAEQVATYDALRGYGTITDDSD